MSTGYDLVVHGISGKEWRISIDEDEAYGLAMELCALDGYIIEGFRIVERPVEEESSGT